VGREIKNISRKTICCFAMGLKKTKKYRIRHFTGHQSRWVFTHLLTDFKGVRELVLRPRLVLLCGRQKDKEKGAFTINRPYPARPGTTIWNLLEKNTDG
jgi:hypothetical protein